MAAASGISAASQLKIWRKLALANQQPALWRGGMAACSWWLGGSSMAISW